MTISQNISATFLKKILAHLLNGKNALMQDIQKEVRGAYDQETKFYTCYRFDQNGDEAVTIEQFNDLGEFWESYTTPFYDDEFQENVFDGFENLIRKHITTIYQTVLKEFSLADIQLLCEEKGYDQIDSFEDVLNSVDDYFDHEINDQIYEYMDEFCSISIQSLIKDSDQQTLFFKKQYHQLVPDKQVTNKIHELVASFIFKQKNNFIRLMIKDITTKPLDPSDDKWTEKFVDHLFDSFTTSLSMEELLMVLKIEEVSLTGMVIIQPSSIHSLCKNTLLFKVVKQTLRCFVFEMVETALKEVSLVKDQWFYKALELYEWTKSKPLSATTVSFVSHRLSDLKNDGLYYYKQFKKEHQSVYQQILLFIQDMHIYQLNQKYSTDIDPETIQIKSWFTELVHTEDQFLHSKEFNHHLKQVSIEVFGHDLSTFYLLKQQSRHFILHIGPTNSGKTHAALLDLKSAKSGIYLAPLRLLALEKFEELNQAGVPCSLKTGEERKDVFGACHISSTVEACDLQSTFEVAVIDECQMITDPHRGVAWTQAVLAIRANRVHIIATPYAKNLLQKLFEYYHFSFEVVDHFRKVPLEMDAKPFHFPKSVCPGDALIVFSKRKVLNVAAKLLKEGHRVSVLYGLMPPETRRMQMAQYREGKTDVLVSTDGIGMGLNLPIHRVIFLETEKFDGKSVRTLNASEVQQIAGRAGRMGISELGLVNASKNRKKIARLLKKEVQPLSKALLPFPVKKVCAFPYQSFELLMRCWNLYRHHFDHLVFDLETLDDMTSLYNKLAPFLKKHGLSHLPLDKVIRYCIIPFSNHDDVLCSYWMDLIKRHETKQSILLPSLSTTRKVDVLEKQYEKLSLYASFMSFVGDVFDEQSVLEKKQQIAAIIFEELSKNLKEFSKMCISCKKELPWDYPHAKCNECYYLLCQ